MSARVAICCSSPAAFIRAHCWSLQHGLTCVLPARADWPKLPDLLADTGAVAVIAGSADAAAFGELSLTIAEALPACALPPAALWPEQLALLFTSGSSGTPQSAAKSAAAILGEVDCLRAQLPASLAEAEFVSTVPLEHMFGYVFAFWLPLLCGARIATTRIVLPQDLRAACAGADRPLCLVTTPTHLRAWCDAGIPFPNVGSILCATAPLGAALAARANGLFDADIIEIYGSTETGALASRRWRQQGGEPCWQPLPGIRIYPDALGFARCTAPHLDAEVRLADRIVLCERGFELKGRDGDLVKVAGKRHSLAALNELLMALPGVRDGVFVSPSALDALVPDGGRLAAFVVADGGCTRARLLDALRLRLDPVFLPRPLYLVDRLPRTNTGKLRSEDLARLWQRCRDEQQRQRTPVGCTG